jgi:antitoxin (DNA-binding transcriptional repressor) of toxin-antitoxin stability system
VSIWELKSKLSKYLRRVKSGEIIILTERCKAIAQIVPPKQTLPERLQAVVDAGLPALAQAQVAEWNGKKLRPHKPAARNRGKEQISDLVVEDRDVVIYLDTSVLEALHPFGKKTSPRTPKAIQSMSAGYPALIDSCLRKENNTMNDQDDFFSDIKSEGS